ncbi:Putative restriction endonuclease domain-containing protein [Tumidithrix helvetica PCC 7403]|uniref:Uma2 family endonuclease n=1 Tax=Tumidithrix helvetica TaxID=3457545 RepID=UPI003C90A20F
MQQLTHKFDVEQYQLMGKAGIFHPEARLELIEGEIVIMTPIGLRHAVTINRLARFFNNAVQSEGVISIQNPIRLPDYSEPQPDITILLPRDDFYAGKFPQAEDTLLLIEVADSSLKYDRTTKLSLYAEYSIPEYWIANLESDILEIYRQPQNKSYLQQTLIDSSVISFSPIAFPKITMTLKDIYGQRHES